jgi:hypothetical protein
LAWRLARETPITVGETVHGESASRA